MFVRDNKCPTCGKTSSMDVYVLDSPADFGVDSLCIRSECYECLSFVSVSVGWQVLHGWIRALSMSAQRAPFVFPRRWSPKFFGAFARLRTKRAILRATKVFFERGRVELEFADSRTLRGISRQLWTSGDRLTADSLEDFRSAWSGL